jgi:hypothetical protein
LIEADRDGIRRWKGLLESLVKQLVEMGRSGRRFGGRLAFSDYAHRHLILLF